MYAPLARSSDCSAVRCCSDCPSTKARDSKAEHRRWVVGLLIALLCIAAGIPWPGLPYGRPLLRTFGQRSARELEQRGLLRRGEAARTESGSQLIEFDA